MKIVVVRHGTVDYTWSRWCTSKEFDKECIEYDKATIRHKKKLLRRKQRW